MGYLELTCCHISGQIGLRLARHSYADKDTARRSITGIGQQLAGKQQEGDRPATVRPPRWRLKRHGMTLHTASGSGLLVRLSRQHQGRRFVIVWVGTTHQLQAVYRHYKDKLLVVSCDGM